MLKLDGFLFKQHCSCLNRERSISKRERSSVNKERSISRMEYCLFVTLCWAMSVGECFDPLELRHHKFIALCQAPLSSSKGTFMNQVTVQEVQQRLLELLKNLNPGEEVQIVAGEQVIGRLVAEEGVARAPRRPGSAVGTLTIVADDKEHLKDFANYMP